MPEENKNKKKISDDEILSTLRKAVLASIGGDIKDKEALLNIRKPDELSKELKSIGRRLIRKKKTLEERGEKAGRIELSEKELEKINAITQIRKQPEKEASIIKASAIKKSTNSSKEIPKEATQGRASQKNRKTRKTTKTPLPQSRQVKKPQQNLKSLLSGISMSGPKLLPKPSFFTRLNLSFTWRKALILLLAVIVLTGGAFLFTVYKTTVNDPFINSIAVRFNLPVAKVNGTSIRFAEFTRDVESLERFFSDDANITAYDFAQLGEVSKVGRLKQLVLDRYIRVILIREALAGFNEVVTASEVQSQLNEVLTASGGEDELRIIVEELYSWSVDDFVNKALLPLLEEERLTIFISQNEILNSLKELLIESIAQEIATGLAQFLVRSIVTQ